MADTTPHALYTTDDGQPIITHSMIKSFRRCPRQALYKYHDRLKPKSISKPLKRGVWIHALLETHYKGGDWRETHKQYTYQFSKLFEEEQAKLGNLPVEIENLITSYFWHYRHDADWKVVETEYTFETEFPDGTIYRCRVDNLVETPYGLYLVDHKSHRILPDLDFRLLDAQSALYIWCARKNKVPVKGFIWNYLKTDAPKQLRFKLDGGLYARQGETDYPTARRSILEAGKELSNFQPMLDSLKAQRYQHGAMQLSSFFRRDTLEKDNEMIKKVVREAIHTTKRANAYPFHKRDFVERNVDPRGCKYMCGYMDLCTTELMGGNTDLVLHHGYIEGDAMDYYKDHEEEMKDK